ncbi:MAG TPA: energy transducer TonB [Acidobacteriaceae bacterium]
MPSSTYAGRTRFGLLPEPESNPGSVITSFLINGAIVALALLLGSMVHHEVQVRKMDSMTLYVPSPPPPEVKIKVKIPPPPKVEVKPPTVAKLEPPKITLPKVERQPELKPLPAMKDEAAVPKIQAAKPAVVLQPQPKAALTAAAPAVTPQPHPIVEATHLGDLNGVKPNANASKAATVAALGNPYGGAQGPAAAPRGVVGSAGIGNGTKAGSNAGSQGRVASAGIPGGNGASNSGGYGNANSGHVSSAGIQGVTQPANVAPAVAAPKAETTPPVLLSHSQPEYTPEAKQLKIQGDVVLRVTITTSGQMIVHNVIHGLGHGLDEQAVRSAPTYKFKPAMQNGQPVEFTTNIIIKFQTA